MSDPQNPQAEGVRLQKVLANAGVASRRGAEDMIVAGRIRVNGATVTELGSRIHPDRDLVDVDGVAVQLDQSKRYVMLNKPTGVVSTMKDEQGRPDLRRFTKDWPERLYNVGRLDAETSGLLVLTNDGELAHVLAHPSFGVTKVYIAKVKGRVQPQTIAKLTRGIELEDGPIAADKARLLDSGSGSSLVELTLHSGRNRIVRRMMAAVDHPVQELVRRYDLDGIHLDYVRYPWSGAGYHPESLATFWRGLALQEVQGPQASPLAAVPGSSRSVDVARRPSTPEERAAWNLFRARQVTLLVERVAAALRAEAPDVELTAAVFPDARRAYEETLQEWPEWLARGLVSGLVLMSYSPSDTVVREWVQRAAALARGKPIYAGIGAYLLSGRPDQLRRQSLAALEAGAAGIVYYSFESLEVEPSLLDALSPAGPSSR